GFSAPTAAPLSPKIHRATLPLIRTDFPPRLPLPSLPKKSQHPISSGRLIFGIIFFQACFFIQAFPSGGRNSNAKKEKKTARFSLFFLLFFLPLCSGKKGQKKADKAFFKIHHAL
ncbi:MAG: hypothetical protein IJF71_05210, partial [Clostridia bacterium]|nr:hypothetical protein [Clostridia bacterium]